MDTTCLTHDKSRGRMNMTNETRNTKVTFTYKSRRFWALCIRHFLSANASYPFARVGHRRCRDKIRF